MGFVPTEAPQRPVHEYVQEHVTAAGLSTADIVKRTGWSEQRVRRLLSGKTDIKADDMRVFADLVGKPVGDLYGGAVGE